MPKIITGILVGIFTTAIARGVVAAFGLDAWVARMIESAVTASPALIEAVGWAVSGFCGLVALILWLIFRAHERLHDLMSQRPALGSLPYVTFAAHVKVNHHTGQTDVEMAVDVQNTNNYLVAFRGSLRGTVNGAQHQIPDFSGFAASARVTSLILRMNNVPPNRQGNFGKVIGMLEYDVRYFAAPAGKRSRRTMKQVNFEHTFSIGMPPGQSVKDQMTTLFGQQVEE